MAKLADYPSMPLWSNEEIGTNKREMGWVGERWIEENYKRKSANKEMSCIVKYRFQGTFYCTKSSKKCVCILSTFYSQ